MRPLNRPMFRYGGPIKEGIMDGIREPKKDGGMLLVGEHPKEFRDASGREKHVAPLVVGAGMGLARLAPLAIRGARALQGLFGSRKFVKDVGTKLASSKNTAPFTPVKQIFEPNKVGKYIMGSPEYRLITGGAGYAGKAGKKLFEGGKYLAKSPLTVGGGLIYVGGKFFKDGKEVPPPPNAAELLEGREGRQFTGDEAMIGDPRKPLPDSKPTLSKEELRKRRIDRYRDIMDIKGMNKAAAYDSLIAASQAINESGDFKGDLKSGRLINQIIQSTSKAFDKPKATKDAIDTLILKGEIESDIAAGKPSTYLKAAQDMVATGAAKNITEAMKTLTKSENSMSTTLAAVLSKGQRLDDKLVGVAYREETGKIPAGSVKLSEVNEWKENNAGKTEVDYVKEILTKTELAPGDYVIGERVVTVDEDKNVSFFY